MDKFSSRTAWQLALLAAFVTLSSHAAAHAQDCSSDQDCGDGYRCETQTYQSCSGGGMCSPDGDCTETEPVCETGEYSYCTNATCTTDADCPASMACQAQTQWQCSGGGAGSGAADAGAPCPPGEMCDVGEPSECTEVPGDSLCIPRYQLPCATANDCGPGFDCNASTYWECSGGMGTGGATGGGMNPSDPDQPADAGVDVPDGECHEVTSDTRYCQLQDLPCEVDADCPADLECQEQYIYPPCTRPAGGTSGGDDGSMDPGDFSCPEPEVQHRCMPHEYQGGGMTPPPGTGGSTGSSDGGVMQPPDEEPGDSDGPGNPGSGSAGGGEDDGASNGSHGHHHGHGHLGWIGRGCSTSGPISDSPLSVIGLGLALWVMRRRAHA